MTKLWQTQKWRHRWRWPWIVTQRRTRTGVSVMEKKGWTLDHMEGTTYILIVLYLSSSYFVCVHYNLSGIYRILSCLYFLYGHQLCFTFPCHLPVSIPNYTTLSTSDAHRYSYIYNARIYDARLYPGRSEEFPMSTLTTTGGMLTER